ncbi:MAG TPA: hypothetical protein VG165_01700, partial [Solirubrobacteraceae bacterium]|nr:hypothetical protein [Solirubrobacteraceae bacterium]
LGSGGGPLAGIGSLEGFLQGFGISVPLLPGQLLISRSVYTEPPSNIVPGVTVLPPGCTSGCATATTDATYPFVWDNDLADGSFGITSKIFLDQVTPTGFPLSSIEVPNGTDRGVSPTSDQMVTSFSSKSELSLNLSTDGRDVTFMGYQAPVNAIDVSNSNTPGAVDPTNPDPQSFYRVVAQLDGSGKFHFTDTSAYSGNNGRAAILDNSGGADSIYTAGNAGNGANPQPTGVVLGAGAQILAPAGVPQLAQFPGAPTPVASFSVTQLGDKADKIGKDDNFRGETVAGNVLYYTKGSGGNGVNTVYFVDTTGHACPNGTGLPAPGAALPSAPLAYNPATVASTGLPSNLCILQGFPTQLAKNTTNSFPFGIWFANPTTLYVADEGNGDTTYSPATGQYTGAAAQSTAGLQKWVLTDGSWHMAYVLQNGLKLGVPYTVGGYPTGTNAATGLPWAPATDGLRNITGSVSRSGMATIYAVTSTVSGNGDQGADPNKVVSITDNLAATTTLPASESFATIKAAGSGEVLRGVSFTPGTFTAAP